jgi:Glycosyltransferase family 10 (fucosyltransferase) C-term
MKNRKVLFVDESGGTWPWARQLRSTDGTWGSSSYTFALDSADSHDWLVVYSAWPQVELRTTIPRSRRIFVSGEPESFHRYQNRFLDQFATVITTQRCTRHSGAVYSQPAINWFAGVQFQDNPKQFKPLLNFSDFESGNPVKSKLCSVVCSSNDVTTGHRQRLQFVEMLRQELGSKIDFFGRGIRTIQDKDDALADYRFHIALENSVHTDYWTEKLADPFLRGCFPIYSGCPNIETYFPAGCYAQIDIGQPQKALEIIEATLQSDLDHLKAVELREAKRLVLNEYNIFALLEATYPAIEEKMLLGANEQLGSGVLFSDHQAKDFKFSRRLRRFLTKLV